MAYNIDTWKTKKLENLSIPLKSLYKTKREDWMPGKPIITNFDTNEVSIQIGEGKIEGILDGPNVNVVKINIYGEGSGTFLSEVIAPALKESTGILEATAVWEGGDSISKEVVINGEYSSETIEL